MGRRKSFRAAALASHLGQPAASQAIAQLEEALGTRLLDRATRPVSLAETFRVLADFDRSVESLGAFVSQGTRRVRVACLSSAVFRLLPPVLARMREEHPHLTVVVDDDNVRGIRKRLESGQCDLGIASADVASDTIAFEPLLDDPFHVLCPHGHALWGKGPIALKALDGQPLILLQKDSAIRTAFDSACAHAGVRPTVAHETRQVHTLLGMVEAGLGAAVLPALACMTIPGRVEARLLRDPAVVRKVGIATSRVRPVMEGGRVFAGFFRERSGKLETHSTF